MKKLENKRIAILTEDGFEEVELSSPKEALENEGANVDIVSPQPHKVRAKQGDEWSTDYTVNVSLQNASVDNYDALVIPGGVINPDKLRVNKDVLKFIKSFFEKGKTVASICHGPQVLINAEVVKDIKLTSVEAIKIDLINAGSKWEDSEVVYDKGLITSRTPDDLPAFNEKLIDVISS
ncbi:type 1 glutamine amidotransferase domain-containing protein [Faecalibacter rhinopitheci]|uniref:Type 1 glutamine amidotransferase n=1 Tax=Faecalibacter rhinopitheci TaxID=2779678 RepID=A0A8J7K2Z1_9FLAO|nr:type 1 glutamine amidotransferase domain-containing protein [Faecalibacter rhinopitheci]MBF0595943.1 type 1 glutamine amidotransferase [Faecalibacter rhinopitheci]